VRKNQHQEQHNMRRAIGLLFLGLALQQLASGGVVAATAPSSGNSTASLLAFINGLPRQSRHILLGQHSNYWDSNPMGIVTPIPAAAGGKQVAILGTSNYWLNGDGVTSSTTPWFVSATNAWLAKGGIVLVSQEPINPFASGEAVTDIWTPGTNANNKWKSYLNTQVALFKQLNGPVLWRPFPEPNENHFGSQFTPAQFVLFWQYTHDYCVSQGLNNVLWVFNLNYWDPKRFASQWYPGSAYVDIVSLDSYPPDSNSNNIYNFYLTTGKPIIFAEVGGNSNTSAERPGTFDNSTILAAVKASFPQAVAIVYWCQNEGLAQQQGPSAVLNDPAVVTLSDLPTAFANGSSTAH
jgi:Glycosyl hydrolase family 26